MGEDEAGQNRGEQGEGDEARHDEKEVPEEVNPRGQGPLLRLLGQEGAHEAVVHGHTGSDG